MTLAPRVVVVHRTTELDELVARHGTRRQAEFFLASRDRSLDEVQARHDAVAAALAMVGARIPLDWRRGRVERNDLARFLFAPDDVVVVVGQDGLVANVAKYLDGQPVIGIDPEPGRNPGVLVRHRAADTGGLLRDGLRDVEARTMVGATTDDGQRLLALNEVFVGHPSHQTARYRLRAPDVDAPVDAPVEERQASSGLIVATGTGATGWSRSIRLERHSALPAPEPGAPVASWFVREAWPSPTTGTERVEGRLGGPRTLAVTSESDALVVFGDGIEQDRLTLPWGSTVHIGVADTRLILVQ